MLNKNKRKFFKSITAVLTVMLFACGGCFTARGEVTGEEPAQKQTTSFIGANGIVSNAEYGVLIDQYSGNVMYSKNAYAKAYPASTTKLMTAILYYDKFKDSMNKTVTVTEEMMNKLPSGSSTMNLEKDEVVTREQLLYGLMLVSGNDAAIVMAYDYSGGIEPFVEEMNKKAKSFGMDSTNFVNPHGFHDANHYTTAADFGILAREYMKVEELRKVCQTSKYLMTATNKKEARTIFNSNRLISSKPEYKAYVYDKATGLKTGYTNNAKNCLVATANDGTKELVWVGFGYGTTEERFTESKNIFEYAFSNYSPISVYKHIKDTDTYIDAALFNIPQYEYGNVDAVVQVNAKEEVMVDNLVAKNLDGQFVETKFMPLLKVNYPINNGDYIGHMEYYVNGKLIYTAKAYATKFVEDRKVPEFFKTSILNKRNNFGSGSFFEQAVALGLETKKPEVNTGNGQNNPDTEETKKTAETTKATKAKEETTTKKTTKKTTEQTSKKTTEKTSSKTSAKKTTSSTTKKKAA